jgi:hypothetical protein
MTKLWTKFFQNLKYSQIKELSETIEQELTSDFLVKEHKDIKFLGKTNKGNLVFENEGQQLKITRKGEIL